MMSQYSPYPSHRYLEPVSDEVRKLESVVSSDDAALLWVDISQILLGLEQGVIQGRHQSNCSPSPWKLQLRRHSTLTHDESAGQRHTTNQQDKFEKCAHSK
jgi:hypothetical protein